MKNKSIDWKKTDSILFDMDGTLWDAIDTYADIWNEAFREIGSDQRITRDILYRYMGMNIEEITSKVVSDFPPGKLKPFIGSLYRIQDQILPEKGGIPYEGMKEGLAELSKYYKLFLVSNCGDKTLPAFMDYTGIRPYVTDWLSYADTWKVKSENMKILQERYSLKYPVYVGDTDGDSRQTRLAGFPFVFARYGFGETDDYDLAFNDLRSMITFFLNLKQE
ncbi:MAG: HAD family hydrolase [Barnesiella sp.]